MYIYIYIYVPVPIPVVRFQQFVTKHLTNLLHNLCKTMFSYVPWDVSRRRERNKKQD